VLDLNEIKTRPGITEERRLELIEEYWRERGKELAYFNKEPTPDVVEDIFNSPFVRTQCD